MSIRNIDRAEQIVKMFPNAELGIEFGTRTADTTCYLLEQLPKLTMITVDSYLAMPWVSQLTQKEKNEEQRIAVSRLNDFGHRVSLWQMDALAAGLLLKFIRADFVYVDVLYNTGWLRRHLPVFQRCGDVMCGGGYEKNAVRALLEEMYPTVHYQRSLWWIQIS